MAQRDASTAARMYNECAQMARIPALHQNTTIFDGKDMFHDFHANCDHLLRNRVGCNSEVLQLCMGGGGGAQKQKYGARPAIPYFVWKSKSFGKQRPCAV